MRSFVFRISLLVCAAAAALLAAENVSPTPTIVDCPAQDPIAGSAGAGEMRAAIDPVTGKLKELSSEEARKLAPAGASLASAPEQFEAVVHSNGMVSVDLHDAFMQDLVLRKNLDGSMTMECNPHAENPKARPSAPPPAPSRAPLEEK